MFYVWLGIIILLTITELLTVNLTTIWFVVSGCVALLLTFITKNFFVQFLVFIVLGVTLFVTSKPKFEAFFHEYTKKKIEDNVLDMSGKITKEVKRNQEGEVVVDGKKWIATASRKIPVGSMVTIEKIDGTKLRVKKLEEKTKQKN